MSKSPASARLLVLSIPTRIQHTVNSRLVSRQKAERERLGNRPVKGRVPAFESELPIG